MKTLTIIFLLFAFTVSAQDSVKINVNIQARDLEYIGSFIRADEAYEDIYDAIKKKFRVANPPAGNTSVAVDSIMVCTWYVIMERLRGDYIAIGANVFSRVDAILRAKNNVWLNGKLDVGITNATNTYTQKRATGRSRLTRK